ncbi:MAG: calcium-binding protein [Nitrospirota bacterium]
MTTMYIEVVGFSKHQNEVMNKIIDYGAKNGFSAEDIAIAVKVAFIESSLGVNLTNPESTASGLFHYLDGSWNQSKFGDKNNIDNQIRAFFSDLSDFKRWYYTPELSTNIPKDQVGFGEYVYIKHHDGRSYGSLNNGDGNYNGVNDFLEAPGLPIYRGNDFKLLLDPEDIIQPGRTNNVIDKTKKLFTTAKTIQDPTILSPIVLDLDRDGVETINVKGGAYFDHDGNGFAEQTGWAGADDGILVRDIDGNGTIDNGKELFGNETLLSDGTKAANGFQALAELDTNSDGKIDSSDAAFTQLKVWKDINEDGVSTADELHTLDELGIVSVNTGYTNSTVIDANGNEHRQVGSFTWNDGTTSAAEDVWVQRDTTYTIANEWLDVPADIAALPDLQGYGNVYDLHQTMVKDTSGQLKSLVEQFMAATDPAVRTSLMEQILFKWTGSDTVDPNSRGGAVDGRQVEVLSKLFGDPYTTYTVTGEPYPYPSQFGTILLKQSYQGVFEMFYSQMMSQTHLKDLYSKITYTWDDETQSIKGDLSAVAADIQNLLTTDPTAGTQMLSEFTRSIKGVNAEQMLNFVAFRATFASQSEELAWTIDSAGKNPVIGTAGDDTITGGDWADAIKGSDGNDIISGGSGNDYLDGGAGDDELRGNAGEDVYVFGRGYGHDVANSNNRTDMDSGQLTADTIQFKEGITINDLELYKVDMPNATAYSDVDLLVVIKGTNDTLTIKNWFNRLSIDNGVCLVGQWKFSDGTVLTRADIDARGYKVVGTDANDNLYGSKVADEINGYGGNDYMMGDEGNDVMSGGEGDDTLYGGSGNDVLEGGSGNDFMQGDTGSDTYKFGIGSGSDTINNSQVFNPADVDTIEFGPGISLSDLELIQEDVAGGWSHLRINIAGASDTLLIQNWFNGDNYKIARFKFADGSVYTRADLDAIGYKLNGTSASESLYGSSSRDIIYGYEGNDNISGAEGNDVLYGGAGDDTLNGDYDDDVLVGGTGNDTLNGFYGNDTYTFNLGDGVDTITEATLSGSTSTDKIVFGPGITSADVEFVMVNTSGSLGADLKVKINGTDDALIIKNWFSNGQKHQYYLIEQFEFADGTALSIADIEAMGYKLEGSAGNDSLYGSDVKDRMYGSEGNDSLSGFEGNDVLYGEAGDDMLSGGSGDDLLQGGDGNDTLYGNEGNDVLEGGAGNDTLQGDAGSDVYRFSRGNGVDKIWNSDAAGNTNTDIVEFGQGITLADLEFLKETDSDGWQNLVIEIKGTSDALKVMGWFNYDTYRVDQFKLVDGTVINAGDLGVSIPYAMRGSINSDNLTGSSGRDEMYGYEGNDTLSGSDGNDVLYGGDGTDNLVGGNGDDILDGGSGNDTLYGDGGNDTYKFGIGSGVDTIWNSDTVGNTNIDTVEFGAGITLSDLEFSKESLNGWNNLVIKIKGTTDILKVTGWFNYDYYKVDQLKFADGTMINTADIGVVIPYTIKGTTANDSLTGSSGRDELFGYEGNDTLSGYEGNDVLNGGAGDDTLYGNAGNDVLDGEGGNDYLSGDAGSDTYKFGIGSGQDRIYNYDTSTDVDTVEFGAGLTSADVEFVKDGTYDMKVNIKGTTDSLKILNWFSGNGYRVEQFKFADGTVITPADLDTTLGYKVYGTTLGESLSGTSFKDEMFGYDGNDTLSGVDGNDSINGGNGDDTLYGGTGNDVLEGGAGNDYLSGDAGNDTYKFGVGSGQDRIYNYDTSTDVDTVEFGTGITSADVEFIKSGTSDLLVSIKGTTDSLKVLNWFTSNSYRVDQFKFTDGTIITPADLDTTLGYKVYGTVAGESLSGTSFKDEMYGYEGNDTLSGNDGNDTLYGGDGADTLYGGNGADVLDGGMGNDSLQGGAGNDTYKFGLGGGVDTINDYDTTVGNSDAADFSVNPLDLILARNGNNLDISINGTTDRLTVQNWYLGSGYQTEVLHTADNSNLMNTQVDQLIQAMASFCTNNGISSWSQAIQDRPQDVQQVLAQYWTSQTP